jgi:hypothetical protein
MEQFTTGDDKTDLTLVSSPKFMRMLSEFLNGLENKEPLEEFQYVKHWYPEAKFVNIEG